MPQTRNLKRTDYKALHEGRYQDCLSKSVTRRLKRSKQVPVDPDVDIPKMADLNGGSPAKAVENVTPSKQQLGADEHDTDSPDQNKDGASDVAADLTPEEVSRQLKAAQDRNTQLRKEKELAESREQLAQLLAENKALQSEIDRRPKQQNGGGAVPKTSIPQKSASTIPEVPIPEVDIRTVRQAPGVHARVKDTFKALGLDESDLSDEEIKAHISARGKRQGRGRKNILRKACYDLSDSDNDQNPCLWAHEFLGPKYNNFGSASIKFKQLDSRTFIAGELNIIRSKEISEVERKGRMNLLCDMIYNMGHYEWEAILRLYAAILSEIDAGNLNWKSDFSRLEQQVLMPFTIRKAKFEKKGDKGKYNSNKPFAGYEDKLLYCNDFQSGNCSHEGNSHSSMFFGKSATVHHVCATCLKKTNKKQYHPDSSPSCPFKKD